MGFSRQEYRSGLPLPSLGDLPHPGMEPRSPALQADSLLSETAMKVTVAHSCPTICYPWTVQSMDLSSPEYLSGSLSLLQGIFPTQGSNPGLPAGILINKNCRKLLNSCIAFVHSASNKRFNDLRNDNLLFRNNFVT